MSEEYIKGMISDVFNDIADAMETGSFGSKVKVGVTLLGSEHGIENMIEGAQLAQENNSNIEVVVIGPANSDTNLKIYAAETEDEQHTIMEKLLKSEEISSVVTMHYNFPIGVSTVGRAITPSRGKEMLIATTTGTSSTSRVEGMIKNAVHGIITAKAIGIEKPTVGILNVDGARQVERALLELQDNGYDINFGESMRSDGGTVMRGNDLLTGTPDIMVADSLTGNILMKMFSSYTTGGNIEAAGFGYGPGVGERHDKTVLIVSRTSGPTVISNAIKFAGEVTNGNISELTSSEFKKAKEAKLDDILAEIKMSEGGKKEKSEVVEAPKSEVVTESISGIDVIDLDDAVQVLWKKDVYAESGMGCTGPIVLINEANVEKATEILTEAGYI